MTNTGHLTCRILSMFGNMSQQESKREAVSTRIPDIIGLCRMRPTMRNNNCNYMRCKNSYYDDI